MLARPLDSGQIAGISPLNRSYVCACAHTISFLKLSVSSVRLTSAADDSVAVKRFVDEALRLKGFAVAVICIGILVTVDYQVCNGVYTDQALQLLRQIGYSFGY